MKLSQFFISRPIFAGVLSALIFLAGLLALPTLPITEYPQVVPPTVVVHGLYPGANPQATADGAMTLTVTFALGTDIDKAQVQVQNRVAQALPKLPDFFFNDTATTE